MKNKHLVILLLSFCCFAACVDSKYDLSDVNTDDAVMGESWVAPLGTGYVTSDDVVRVEKVPSIREVDGAYVVVYDGAMKIKGKSLRAASDKVVIASEEITTGDIDGLFDGDFVLALTDPHITLKSDVTKASLDCNLSIEAENAGKKESASSDFTLSAVSPAIWIGPLDPKTDAFKFIKNEQLPGIVQIVPQKIRLALSADSEQWMNAPMDALSELRYAVELPLAPAPEFSAVSVERIENAFDEDFVDYIFSDGSARIYGEVTNEMPFDMSVEMVILDENDVPVGIQLPAQDVKGPSGEVVFEITKEDMPKMKDARHIDLRLHLTGRDQGEALKKGQKTTFNLKLEKEGGISI
ncbi:DUF4621 domain-containing protein [Parabacteroides sp. ZJ-118]|uniref:DUF4621 domain-containing protein n=1 Tax=Parabacteroides sp. ZJ-118 TaxID=2709398 RepID=UPI0013EC9512|nr:DUF4621 domain-containing protein [Parabacteroides sp. ZJ-118]